MKLWFTTVFVVFLGVSSPFAATVSPIFTDEGYNSSTATGTRLYRADLTGLGLDDVAAITINDSNSGYGGSSGAYSGFDLDAIFLDRDGDAETTGDQVHASSYLFSAGTLRPGGRPSNTDGPTNGSASTTSVDEAFATLDAIDAIWFGQGSLTLGDGGSLTALFSPEVAIGASLHLFVGEVSGDPGETVSGLIEVADVPPTPAVPLPAPALLLLTGLGGLAIARRRG